MTIFSEGLEVEPNTTKTNKRNKMIIKNFILRSTKEKETRPKRIKKVQKRSDGGRRTKRQVSFRDREVKDGQTKGRFEQKKKKELFIWHAEKSFLDLLLPFFIGNSFFGFLRAVVEKLQKEKVPWQWKDDAGDWNGNEFGVEDADMLEKKYNEGTISKFSTTDFSWNQEHQNVFSINFKKDDLRER